MKVLGERELVAANVNFETNTAEISCNEVKVSEIQFDIPIKGTVYSTLLNYKGALAELGDTVNNTPYNSPPIAPILYIKPANTFNCHRAAIPMPVGITKLVVGAALGIVIAKKAIAVNEANALNYIAGYIIVNDVCIPHDSVYRPAVPYYARDGFCPIGPWIIDRHEVVNPDDLAIRVFINDKLQQENSTANLIRPISRLLADVTEFMTLYPGDVLLVGTPENAPLVEVGDKVRIEIAGIGILENVVMEEKERVRWLAI
ncbi:fumarylacetoacetate hydrolase family protein [Bacillus sp. FJAT-22090]|uniref:fumarylacetoacetate hydrolase family protein n=1 Tax=Bacillus sp. FJAT-22090 TaxID=1581038 RepID=UPI0011AA6182|nr:fumarylacetoacetate hydrolase family protein [Bacillus sp. FJAT-22090]